MSRLNIGLFGFGVVGEGIYQVLTQKPQLEADIKKIVIKDIQKKREAPADLFSTEASAILADKNIDLVVELIDDPIAALDIVTRAIKNGKSVVSANKQMIARNHVELIQLSKEHGVSFLYEAAACGSVPIVRNLEEYFNKDLLSSVEGIVNGSTNYILSNMLIKKLPYEEVLSTAQTKGFAESDPSVDVDGLDASYKLSILILHAFGKRILPQDITVKGITSLRVNDFEYAVARGKVIKLLAKSSVNEQGEVIFASVLPTFIDQESALGKTNNEYNGVLVEGSLDDNQFFYGKGAGRYPTSSAVFSDISAFKSGYEYGYRKGIEQQVIQQEVESKFYVSFDNKTAFDTRIFEQIDEHFVNKTHTYITGTIKSQTLKSSGILAQADISVVAID